MSTEYAAADQQQHRRRWFRYSVNRRRRVYIVPHLECRHQIARVIDARVVVASSWKSVGRGVVEDNVVGGKCPASWKRRTSLGATTQIIKALNVGTTTAREQHRLKGKQRRNPIIERLNIVIVSS